MARLSVFAKMFQSRLVRLRPNVHFFFLSVFFILTILTELDSMLQQVSTKFCEGFHNKPNCPSKFESQF